MKGFFFSILFLLVAVSCNQKEKLPPGILPEEKMIAVMVEFQLAEAAILQKQKKGEDINFYTQYYYNSILDKNKITRKEFTESVDYYKTRMDAMDELYTEVLNRLSGMQSEKDKK